MLRMCFCFAGAKSCAPEAADGEHMTMPTGFEIPAPRPHLRLQLTSSQLIGATPLFRIHSKVMANKKG